MSANNWARCPRCINLSNVAAEQQAAAIKSMYGKVTAEEYNAALASLCEKQPVELDETFREDYEIYGAAEGEIVVDYSGGCSTCGLDLSFTVKKHLYG